MTAPALPWQITPSAEPVAACDFIDRAADRLRVLHAALTPEARAWCDELEMSAIWAGLESVIADLVLARDWAAEVEGQLYRDGPAAPAPSPVGAAA